jgi:hypothetical protein
MVKKPSCSVEFNRLYGYVAVGRGKKKLFFAQDEETNELFDLKEKHGAKAAVDWLISAGAIPSSCSKFKVTTTRFAQTKFRR